MNSADLAIGVDVGGTRIKAGLVDRAGHLVKASGGDSPGRMTDPAKAVEATVEVVHDLLRRLDPATAIVGVGVGVAGFVDGGSGEVVYAPHLAWRNEPLAQVLQARLGLPVVVDNDANAAAWGEHRFGAGRGVRHLVMVTLGTGIGGALVVDGQLWRGAGGLAGEFGHMVVVPQGRACECGNHGCWEQYASGSVLRRSGRAILQGGGPRASALLGRCGEDADRLSGQDVTSAARAGDPAALEAIEEVGRWLGMGLANLAAALDPSGFVIGGGVSEAGEMLLVPARAALAAQLPGRGYRPLPWVRAAALGAQAGVVGAADLVRHRQRLPSDRM